METNNEMFSRLLLNDVSDAIIASDTEHVIREWNPAAEKLYGYTRDEVAGLTVLEVTCRRYLDTTREEVLKQFDRDGFWEGDVREKHKDGRSILVHTRVSQVHSVTGEYIGLVAINRDITQERKIQEEFLQKSRLEFMGFLIGSVSHLLNNHLTAILGSISVSRHYAKDHDKIQNFLSKAEQACFSIRNTIRQLMFVSGDVSPVYRSLDIHSVIQQAIRSCQSCPDIRFHLNTEPDLPKLWGNPDHLLLVFRNIFDNAVEAMENSGDISITAAIDNEFVPENNSGLPGVTIRVTDTGPGIAAELYSKVFEPFFSTRNEARGLGLAVSRSIVRQHGGSIMVASPDTGGAQVVISLPVPTPGTCKNKENPVRILVFEPDDLMCQVLCDLIRELGCFVCGATTGRESFDEFSKYLEDDNAFNLVILDIDGENPEAVNTTIARIRKEIPNIRVIAASGNTAHPLRAEFAIRGFTGWLTKPYRLEDIEKEISRVTGL